MNNILIRTAGGRAKEKGLGLGHIYRVINLAEELKNNKIYFSLEDFGGAKEILKKNGYDKIETITNELKTAQEKIMFAREKRASASATEEGLQNRKRDLLERIESDLKLSEA
ncbi:MAG TPA: hypothetical protein QF656_00020, partial [Nitrosopumilus sp.]|nr:hypothetical protein [Nitrosopumilus sp.]